METNSNIEKLQEFENTINNVEEFDNIPDECKIMDIIYDYKYPYAIPFIVYRLDGEKHIVFGTNSTVHNTDCVRKIMLSILANLDNIADKRIVNKIYENIPNAYDENFFSLPSIKWRPWRPPQYMYVNGQYLDATQEYKTKEIIKWILRNYQYNHKIIEPLTKLYNDIFQPLPTDGNPYGHIRGRLFDIEIKELNKNCCFIGTWQNTDKTMYDYIIQEINKKLNKTFTDYYLLNGTKEMINLKNTDNNETQPTMQDLKKQFFIHLANQKDKRNALADFRKTRDEKNAQKLGPKMTQAQYNALRYVDENKEENKTKRKFIFTESQIKHIIKENMNNELANYPQSFNMDTFKSLNSYNKKIKYCNDNLQRIASGSSRVVYKIDNVTVLKLAKNKKGLAQNEAETQYRDDIYAPDIFAEVYDNDENFYWIEMQLARKAKPTDFKRITGYNFETFTYFVLYSARQYLPRKKYGFSIPPEYEELFDSEEFKNMVWENPDSVFYQINEYLTSYQIHVYGDIQRISSWGVVKDKQDGTDKLVLIDYGLTDDIYENYYSYPR